MSFRQNSNIFAVTHDYYSLPVAETAVDEDYNVYLGNTMSSLRFRQIQQG
ncbi:hypothetical protein Cflav_PD0211 [Pedosphaera parvula Ellin514]|uniref:Uncharacterized protein n=1 Tax=Pedosphaera parvula (strain Ellin514) TaxID=320771 RepID=B9XSH2_PEDPL|nr:hypothetical protein Cflav_PD0211 [Pedosphaera parvula Ellin514]